MTTATIGNWKLCSTTGVSLADHPEAVRGEVTLNGHRAGSVIRHGNAGAWVYIAGYRDFTVGTFDKLGDALEAIEAKALELGQGERTKAPLFVVSCSATKRAAAEPVPFIELYDGPMWRQVRASAVSSSSVAALSAEHGYLAPDSSVAFYDRPMTEARLEELTAAAGDGFADAVAAHDSVLVFGGELYRRLVRAALAHRPGLEGRVKFATGSFLKQRKQLGEALRAQVSA